MAQALPLGPLFATAPPKPGHSPGVAKACENGERPQTLSELFESLRELNGQGHIALPGALRLASSRGDILLFGDFLEPLLNQSACQAIVQSRGWLEELQKAGRLARENATRVFPLDNPRLTNAYGIDEPLERWARTSCSRWTEHGFFQHRPSLLSGVRIVAMTLSAHDPCLWPEDDPSKKTRELDQIYARRENQARQALAQLGPWSRARVAPTREIPTSSGAAKAQRDVLIEQMGREFIQEADQALARSQAREIERSLGEAPPRRARVAP